MSSEITIGDADSALIIRGDGSVEMRIPKGEDDEQVPFPVIAMASFASALCNYPEMIDPMIDAFRALKPKEH